MFNKDFQTFTFLFLEFFIFLENTTLFDISKSFLFHIAINIYHTWNLTKAQCL